MSGHLPVMLREVIEALSPRDGAQYVDGTFGGGGYSSAILEAADCRVLGIDRDPAAIARGQDLVRRFGGRLTLVEGEFGHMNDYISETDGVVLDLGVSSFQFDQPARGFSFREDGPLDMRMSLSGESAADVVNTADERTLTQIIARYGEEKNARRIARAIIAARPITGTAQLAAIVSDAQGPAALRLAIHPATRTFQALRIHVNDELGELVAALQAAERILKPHGRLVAISFHSLEDRIVKSFLAGRGEARAGSRHAPELKRQAPTFRALTKRPVVADDDEIARNPRARSAKLRAAEREPAPARNDDASDLLPRLPTLADVLKGR